MTTLIVGCGYLGRRVSERLIERGEHVLGTTRQESRCDELASMGIEPVVLDVLNPSKVPAFDRLLYCVGFDRTAGVSRRSVYIEGLSRFLDRIQVGPGPFVYTGSTAVYGQDDGSFVTEDDRTEPRYEAGLVGLEAERLASDRGASILRLAGLYGPGRIIRRAALLANEPIPGDPDKFVNLVHIDDTAIAAIAALESGRPGRVYNVVDDRPVARCELYSLTAACLNASPPGFEAGQSLAQPDEPDRRVANHRMKQELGVILQYPDVSTGIPASIAAEQGKA